MFAFPARLRLTCHVQTEIERLKRQIAEREAAKRAARAQTPAVTKVTALQGINNFFFCHYHYFRFSLLCCPPWLGTVLLAVLVTHLLTLCFLT